MSYWFTADNTVLFSRQWQRRKVSSVDLGPVMEAAARRASAALR